MNKKSCCILGHRKIEKKPELVDKLYLTIEQLINDGVDTFLFGSKSEFNNLCYDIISTLKQKYSNLARVKYNAPYEMCFTNKQMADSYNEYMCNIYQKYVFRNFFEKSVNSIKSWSAKNKAYIVRNQQMIDESDICLFYYNPNYLPPKHTLSKHSVTLYQSKSGTAIAYNYALSKKKKIINIYK